MFYQLLRTARPRQWLKNLSLYAAIAFSGELFRWDFFSQVSKAFVVFCLASSAVYIFNDLVDAPKDRLHPIKKNRPIASGRLSPQVAVMAIAILLGVVLVSAWYLSPYFLGMILLYLLLQIAYTFKIREVIILDAMTVAAGFILRVYAGSVVVMVSLSSWIVLTTIGLALLMAFGKRRSERTILEGQNRLATRGTLEHYPDTLLDAMISMSSAYTIISYSLFAFQNSPVKTTPFFLGFIPQTLASPKWMMLTIPLVIYGVARYLYVIYEKKEAESPERVLLSDYPLLGVVTLWALSLVLITYGFI